MAGVPFIFGNATTSIPLSNLDANFNTGLTIGNTTVGLGNTVTTLGNVTLNNATISGATGITQIANGNSNVVIASSGGNINVGVGGANVVTFNSLGNMNFVVSNAGINFNNSSAIGAATLNDYETGSWTTTFGTPTGLSNLSLANNATYIKIGKQITLFGYITATKTNGPTALSYCIFSIPFSANTGQTACGMAMDNQSEYFASIAPLAGPTAYANTYILVPASSLMATSAVGLFMFSYTYQATF